MSSKDILDFPDDFGWYFYKQSNKCDAIIVFVNENGVAFYMDQDGNAGELEDLKGKWVAIDSF